MCALQDPGSSIRDVDELEELLSQPDDGVVESLGRLDGDLLLLGASGKMGPTLARMARRAFDAAGVSKRVIAVARFSTLGLEERMQSWGIETLRCDLLKRDEVDRLPRVPNVLFMTGRKFGTRDDPSLSWAMNVVAPTHCVDHFAGSNVVAFSTGNVYGNVSVASGGSKEEDTLRPDGEYAMSAVGRERVFEHAARRLRSRVAVVRLNYAVEPRYGVLLDIAQRVQSGHPIDLSMGYVNVIWQRDANAMTLRSFDLVESPARVVNVAGPELLRVKELALEFGRRLGRAPAFQGTEAEEALLNDASASHERFGKPQVAAARVVEWVADWLNRGLPTHGLPTHFEATDGSF